MSDIPRQIRRMRVGQVFCVTTSHGTDWWLREPMGYRWTVDWHGAVVPEPCQNFYPLRDEDWEDDATMIQFGNSESARILAVIALSGHVPEEYR